MSARESRIWKLMAARLRSARGVVLLEFGIFAPFILIAVLFASDFLRVLYCEQQLEIACRALCDIEAHLKPGKRTIKNPNPKFATYDIDGLNLPHDVSGCPGQPGKLVVMHYLASAIGADSNVKMLTAMSSGYPIYARGYFYNQVGVIHNLVNIFADKDAVAKAIKDKVGGGLGDFLNIGLAVFSGLMDFFTMRTDRYLSDVFPTDKVVAVSLSVQMEPTLSLPKTKSDRGLFYRKATLSDSNASVIPMYEPDWTKPNEHRTRFYYHMPSFDTAPLAPDTYGRHMADAFPSWITKEK